MSSSSFTCSHDEEQATVAEAPFGKTSTSTSTPTSTFTSTPTDTTVSTFPKARQNTPTTTSTSTSPSGGTISYNNNNDKEKGSGEQLQDTHDALARVRFLVVTAILLLGAYTAWGTFRVIKGKDTEQEQDNTDNVNHIAKTMAETVAQQTVQRLEQVQSMSHALGQTITVQAIQANATFPMFQLPSQQFDQYAAEALQTIPGLQAMVYAPVVPQEQRQAWETYQMTQEGGIIDDMPQVMMYEDRASGGDYALPVAQVATVASHSDATALSELPTRHQDLLQQHAWMARAVLLASTQQQQQQQQQQQPSQPAIWSGILPHDHASDVNEDTMSAFVSLQSCVMVPIQASFGQQQQEQQQQPPSPAGFIVAIVDWEELLGQNYVGVDSSVVFHSECGKSDTITSNILLRKGHYSVPPNSYTDLRSSHPDSDTTMIHRQDNSTTGDDMPLNGLCSIRLSFYTDSDTFLTDANITAAIISSSVVVLIFLGILVLFALYDASVSRRQTKLHETASKMYTIISGLFPKIVKDRMLSATANVKHTKKTGADSSRALVSFQDAPIADLFPHATIFFADIVGFTAWSSMREPSQVFILLESVFNAFDELAHHYGIFKVETVGDCYVAACGVPDARNDHAVAMARFAVRCVQAMQKVTKDLELTLGPDTTDLDVRIGLHSGSVTAGVLRGERARFQLFGDTMNTASRIEANGAPGRIHISQETASLLRRAGKESWLKSRDGTIIAKGKGELNTFWLKYRSPRKDNTKSKPRKSDEVAVPKPAFGVRAEDFIAPEERRRRLVEYNKDVLLRLLKRVVAAHRAKPPNESSQVEHDLSIGQLKHPVEEVTEVINIPNEDYSAETSGDVSEAVVEQLELYISDIAGMYKSNPFHNFEHASHVGMSVVKLMSRIVDAKEASRNDFAYGITSDPLTQFASVFSALVHDVDHSGAPNNQLIKEGGMLAKRYNNKSVAEQNSIDIAWNLLYCPEFGDLRQAIMPTKLEQRRFRQLLVNSVMATDIMDKDLKNARNARWDRAFKKDLELALSSEELEDEEIARNRKATIVIEHLIQASDVAHTMQHWHVYRKWNERLFAEMLRAYLAGRAEKHPVEFWYQGEIGFFDFYIIPLAKKLKECGVFGVSSDEYLNYALKNREEWVAKGRDIVAEMMARVYLHK